MGSTTDERDWHELHSNGLCIRNIFCKGVAPIAQKPPVYVAQASSVLYIIRLDSEVVVLQ